MAKILVTGGTGFIGIPLVKQLYDLGHEIILLKRENSNLSPFRELSKINYINGDVRDIESIRKAAEGIEFIYHLAAYTGIWAKEKTIYQDINVKGTENVAMVALDKDIPLLYVSSFTALGPTPPEPVDETHDNPQFYMEYEKSKYQAKKLIKELIPKGLKVQMFYPGIVFGPGDFNIFGRMLYDVMRGKILPLGVCPGKGESMTCLSYVKDLSNILAHSFERKDLYGEDFILGGENVKFKEYLDLIADISRGKKAPKLPFWIAMVYAWSLEVGAFFTKKPPFLTRPTLKAIKYHRAYSSKKAIDKLGYKITPLRKALEETIKWYKEFEIMSKQKE
jgi:nucleoside-diphosphate-sugar epimerase